MEHYIKLPNFGTSGIVL